MGRGIFYIHEIPVHTNNFTPKSDRIALKIRAKFNIFDHE